LVVAEAAIDALSVAAIESLPEDTFYAAAGGGMGSSTIAALEVLLTNMAMHPGALFCSAADANGPGDRFADRDRSLAEKFGVPFARLRPPVEGGDWNDVLRRRRCQTTQLRAISFTQSQAWITPQGRSTRPKRPCVSACKPAG
jgi:hypothetical protein